MDIYVHISSIEKAGLATPNEGQKVSFEIKTDNGKNAAIALELVQHRAGQCLALACLKT